ncbi:hypothetical protein KIN20_023008 [Parelaphostrongylus tenuis]|uniref:Uncharacterized protein n=1 Tax=Parelaphostrongylus tenuis TaxID=148309 RepID=A0AAD5N8K3_PARTN|nr:hypothetical protein KIN20_023008 [Parelaphostrongylus tenuis]
MEPTPGVLRLTMAFNSQRATVRRNTLRVRDVEAESMVLEGLRCMAQNMEERIKMWRSWERSVITLRGQSLAGSAKVGARPSLIRSTFSSLTTNSEFGISIRRSN